MTSPDIVGIDDADAGVSAITDTGLGVAVDAATDADADTGTDGNIVSDTAAPVDAIADGNDAVDVANNDALDAVATEPTEPAVAPLDCPNLPVMCGTGGAAPWIVDSEAFVPGIPTARSSAWSRWIPRKLAAVGQHTVRVWASWHNQRYLEDIVDTNGFVSKYPEATKGCHGTKASLLPSGCVIFDVSTQSGEVTKVAFEPMAPDDWEPEQVNPPFPETKIPPKVWCSGVGTYGAEEMMSATAADGTTVTAWPGRASMHLLPGDHLADPSPLVRDLSDGSTASVLELKKGAETMPTPVEADVSVCRATVEQILASGCACPDVMDLPGAVTPLDNYVRLTWPAGVRVYSRSWFDSLGIVTWTRAGVPKTDGLAWTCASNPPIDAENWQCGGNALVMTPWLVTPVVALVNVDTANVRLSMSTVEPAWVLGGIGIVPFSPYDPKEGPEISVSISLEDSTLASSVSARTRDGASTRVGVTSVASAYKDFPAIQPELEIVAIDKFSSKFEYRNVAIVSRQRHFNGVQLPGGIILGKVDGFLSTWEPK